MYTAAASTITPHWLIDQQKKSFTEQSISVLNKKIKSCEKCVLNVLFIKLDKYSSFRHQKSDIQPRPRLRQIIVEKMFVTGENIMKSKMVRKFSQMLFFQTNKIHSSKCKFRFILQACKCTVQFSPSSCNAYSYSQMKCTCYKPKPSIFVYFLEDTQSIPKY